MDGYRIWTKACFSVAISGFGSFGVYRDSRQWETADRFKRELRKMFGKIAANLIVGTVLLFLWAFLWIKSLPFFFSAQMVRTGIEPWQGTVVLLPVMALLLCCILWVSGLRRPVGWSVATMGGIIALAVSQYAWIGPAGTDMVIGRAFTVAEFVRERGGKTQTLAFIGLQHLADLAYYVELDREIGRLTKQGYLFFYEETDAFEELQGVDTIFYDMPVARLYIDLVRQVEGGHWPSSDPRKWERRDLGKNVPQVIEAKKGDAEGAKCRIHRERDMHLLDEIDGFKDERLAVVYGLSHLANIYERLVGQGWWETSVRVLPAGRKPLDLDGYCDLDVDLRRLEPFAAKVGATINRTTVR